MTHSLVSGETFRRLSEQAKRLPNKPNVSTLWRWYRKGCRGVYLEVTLIGGIAHCSDEALDRFLAELNEPREPKTETPRSKRERTDSKKRAARILERAGI